MICAVCGQGGYWVAFSSQFGEARCVNHLQNPRTVTDEFATLED